MYSHGREVEGQGTFKDLFANFICDFERCFGPEINAYQSILELFELVVGLVDVPVRQQLVHYRQLLPCFLCSLEDPVKVSSSLLP